MFHKIHPEGSLTAEASARFMDDPLKINGRP
jgi:hypothetical protein